MKQRSWLKDGSESHVRLGVQLHPLELDTQGNIGSNGWLYTRNGRVGMELQLSSMLAGSEINIRMISWYPFLSVKLRLCSIARFNTFSAAFCLVKYQKWKRAEFISSIKKRSGWGFDKQIIYRWKALI